MKEGGREAGGGRGEGEVGVGGLEGERGESEVRRRCREGFMAVIMESQWLGH